METMYRGEYDNRKCREQKKAHKDMQVSTRGVDWMSAFNGDGEESTQQITNLKYNRKT